MSSGLSGDTLFPGGRVDEPWPYRSERTLPLLKYPSSPSYGSRMNIWRFIDKEALVAFGIYDSWHLLQLRVPAQ